MPRARDRSGVALRFVRSSFRFHLLHVAAAQLRDRVMVRDPRARLGRLQDLRDLPVREVVVGPQHDHRALELRQLGDAPLQELGVGQPLDASIGPRRRVRDLDLGDAIEARGYLSTLARERIVRQPNGDPVEPGRERRAALERPELLPGADERVLSDVHGEVVVARELPERGVRPGLVTLHERPIGPGVPAPRQLDELRVVQPRSMPGSRPPPIGRRGIGNVKWCYTGGGAARRTPTPRSRGSMASRSPSPNRLNPRTTRPIARPGKTEIQGAVLRKSRPSEIIEPQDGVGGWAPRPMNESAASSRIAPAIPSVTAMIAGARVLGRTCRVRSRASFMPSARAAWMKSSSRTTRVCERTRRASPAQPTTPIATNTT